MPDSSLLHVNIDISHQHQPILQIAFARSLFLNSPRHVPKAFTSRQYKLLATLPCAITTRPLETIAMRTPGPTLGTPESAVCYPMRTNLPYSWTKERGFPTFMSTQRGL